MRTRRGDVARRNLHPERALRTAHEPGGDERCDGLFVARRHGERGDRLQLPALAAVVFDLFLDVAARRTCPVTSFEDGRAGLALAFHLGRSDRSFIPLMDDTEPIIFLELWLSEIMPVLGAADDYVTLWTLARVCKLFAERWVTFVKLLPYGVSLKLFSAPVWEEIALSPGNVVVGVKQTPSSHIAEAVRRFAPYLEELREDVLTRAERMEPEYYGTGMMLERESDLLLFTRLTRLNVTELMTPPLDPDAPEYFGPSYTTLANLPSLRTLRLRDVPFWSRIFDLRVPRDYIGCYVEISQLACLTQLTEVQYSTSDLPTLRLQFMTKLPHLRFVHVEQPT